MQLFKNLPLLYIVAILCYWSMLQDTCIQKLYGLLDFI